MSDLASQVGKVISVSLSATHTFSKQTAQSVRLLTGLGVEGDAHMGKTVKHRSWVAQDPTQPNLRQVHLIHTELFDELRNMGFRVEPAQMGENITTRGINLLGLSTGTKLYIGEQAIIEITGPSLLRFSNTRITASDIAKIVCSPRDMTVHLGGFSVAGDSRIDDLMVRRAIPTDYKEVLDFVRGEFGERWLQSVKHGFEQEQIPIFVAVDNRIKGFACYDVVRMKKGTFGPMGTSMACRDKGIGKTLLCQCLSDMQRIGYDYAVINNAGPLEFYEKACGAVVIPLSDYELSLHC